MDSRGEEETVEPIVFKKKCRPSGLSVKRKTRDNDDDDNEAKDSKASVQEDNEDGEDGNIDWQTLDNLKEFQKLKRKVNKGISVDDLLAVKKSNNETSKVKKVTGGLQDKKSVASDLDLGNTFSAETQRRDEDAEMAKFIESELAKRKGLQTKDEDDGNSNKMKVMKSVDELVFNVLPNDLLQAGSSKERNEEMLPAQMLLGIPEVNLGIDERVRNLEETERATRKLLATQAATQRHKSLPDFTPNNTAVDFNHRPKKNKNVESKSDTNNKSSVIVVQEPVVVIGDEPREASFKSYNAGERQLKHPGQQKASDDYHFERFRKQFKKK